MRGMHDSIPLCILFEFLATVLRQGPSVGGLDLVFCFASNQIALVEKSPDPREISVYL